MTSTTQDAFVYDAVRTPFGKYAGALAGVRPDDLAALVVKEQVRRAPGLDPTRIDEVILGNANGAGEENRNVARMAVLLAGLPVSVPGTTVNRLCGSGLDAVITASRMIECGDAEVVLAGGVESMSRAPLVLLKPEKPFQAGNLDLVSSTLGWRLVNPHMQPEWTVSLGEATERLGEKYQISRERQDAFAVRSHQLATQAWESGFFDDQIVAVPDVNLARDEPIRAGTTVEALASLRPSFRDQGGTVTAGNASPLTDGASSVLVGSAAASETLGLAPLARVVARASAANEPQFFGYAPVEAVRRALQRARIDLADVGLIELNEAFAAQSLACIDAWGVDPTIVNPHGGAIALGHPLGASGGRLVGMLARGLVAGGHRYGVAALCIGVGQALAIVLENVAAPTVGAAS